MNEEYIKNLLKKENNLLLFQSADKTQDFYVLGTIHQFHYTESNSYSLADIQSVIDIVEPDILLIEARQETIDNYGVLDGPSEMIFAWCYAKGKEIDVRGIDWWVMSDDAHGIDAQRDDRMFDNILAAADGKKKSLTICGATHRERLQKKFTDKGLTEIGLTDKEQYFGKADSASFVYPEKMAEEIRKKINYSKTGLVDEILSNTSETGEMRDKWLKSAVNMEISLNAALDNLIIPNKLFEK